MNVLAFDIGDKRIGLAYGNTTNKVATPISVLALSDILNKSKNFTLLLDDYQIQKFIFGLPVSLDGKNNLQAKKIKDIAINIANTYSREYEFVDERYSSKQAKQILSTQGYSQKKMRGKIDCIAASLFLETWLINN